MLGSRSLASVYGVGDETLECEIILTISTDFFPLSLYCRSTSSFSNVFRQAERIITNVEYLRANGVGPKASHCAPCPPFPWSRYYRSNFILQWIIV